LFNAHILRKKSLVTYILDGKPKLLQKNHGEPM